MPNYVRAEDGIKGIVITHNDVEYLCYDFHEQTTLIGTLAECDATKTMLIKERQRTHVTENRPTWVWLLNGVLAAGVVGFGLGVVVNH